MKILICTTDDYPHHGGKSTHIGDLTSGLKKIGIDYEIIDRSKINNFKYKFIKLLFQPIKLVSYKHYIYYRKKLEFFLFKQMFKKVIIKNKNSVISAQDAAACTIIGRIGLNVPIVLTMHTYIGIELTLDNSVFREGDRLYESLYKFELESLAYADSVITVDKRIEKHIRNLINTNFNYIDKPNRVLSIANFTDTEKFRITSQDLKDKLRIKNKLSKDDFVICCIRRLVEKNGVLTLVKAINILKNHQIKCLIAGDGPQMPVIEKYIIENGLSGKIQLLGSLDNKDILEIYAVSDIAVVPSITVNGLQEATSISAIESMACGLPTIASNIGGLKQLFIHKKTGILVEENNPDQLAEAIVELMNNKNMRIEIGRNAREFIVNNHSHIKATELYMNEYKIAFDNNKNS